MKTEPNADGAVLSRKEQDPSETDWNPKTTLSLKNWGGLGLASVRPECLSDSPKGFFFPSFSRPTSAEAASFQA